jgi:hypothetical protein
MKSNVPSLMHIFFKKPLTWFDVSFILIRCCPRPFLGSILHTEICDFGKVCFILEIACVAVILIWSLSSLFLVTSFVPRHKITFPMCVLGVLILEVDKLIHCSTLSSVAPDTDALIVFWWNWPRRLVFEAPRIMLTLLPLLFVMSDFVWSVSLLFKLCLSTWKVSLRFMCASSCVVCCPPKISEA